MRRQASYMRSSRTSHLNSFVGEGDRLPQWGKRHVYGCSATTIDQTVGIVEPLNPILRAPFPLPTASSIFPPFTNKRATCNQIRPCPPFDSGHFSFLLDTCSFHCPVRIVQQSTAMAIALAEADKYEILEKIGMSCHLGSASCRLLYTDISFQDAAPSASFERSSGNRMDS